MRPFSLNKHSRRRRTDGIRLTVRPSHGIGQQRLQSEAQATGIALEPAATPRGLRAHRFPSRSCRAWPLGRQGRDGPRSPHARPRGRTTKDLDLGLREQGRADAEELRDRLIDALAADPDGDGFTFAVGPATELGSDEAWVSLMAFLRSGITRRQAVRRTEARRRTSEGGV